MARAASGEDGGGGLSIIIGIVGVGWIDQKQLTEQVNTSNERQFRHPPLSEELRNIIKQRIMDPLSEVRPMTLDKWEDGFRRDIHPQHEIAVWCDIAEHFKAFVCAIRGRILQRPFHGKLEREHSYAWDSLVSAVADLPATELLEKVRRAYAEG